jgi:RHS repeat-associated protein
MTASWLQSGNGGNLISTLHYNSFGRPLSSTLGNGIGESWGYDSRGRIQSYAAGTLYSFSVTKPSSGTGYAPDGQILFASDSANGQWSYTYDDFNRLSTSICASTCPDQLSTQAFTYGYDRYGNRWSQVVTAGTGPQPIFNFNGPVLNNRVGGVGQSCPNSQIYCYDASGNVISDGTHSYAYDAEGRLLSVDHGITATYIYDAAGRRVSKTTSSGTVNYLYGQNGSQIVEVAGGTTTSDRVEALASGRHIATYAAGSTFFNHTDWLGTERVRSTLAGSICETVVGLPFGDGQVTSGSCGDPSPFHFTGKQRDAESNLDDFGSRHYDSTLGRFLQPDPSPAGIAAGDPQSWNLYSYVRNRPTSSIDTHGNWVTDIHADIVTFALQGYLSSGALGAVRNEQYIQDNKHNSMGEQYEHAMRIPGETAEHELNAMWSFVESKVEEARKDVNPDGTFTKGGLSALGDAIHAVQDWTSPMHTDASGEPAVWYGKLHAGSLEHFEGEASPEADWSRIGLAFKMTVAVYLQANPDDAAKHGLTEKTFDAEVQSRIENYIRYYFAASNYWNSQARIDSAAACAQGNPAGCTPTPQTGAPGPPWGQVR